MKGFAEILLTFTVGMSCVYAYSYLHPQEERKQINVEPTVSLGESADPKLELSWGLKQIHAPEAWKRHRGSRDVVVAVIDTGCDVHHPDLTNNIWINPGETGIDANGNPQASNGIDDDNNGFVDDIHGWNFTENSADLRDDHGHGTHIAGIIGAEPFNGVSGGTSPRVSLMILKYYDTESDGKANLVHTISAIRYAVRMGADIINYSGGGMMKSQAEEEALRWAASQGVLVVAAAGNEGMNSDFYHFYPADYNLPNILSVGAIDQQEQLLRMSNYGAETVTLAAPGKNIYSTLPNGQHGYMSGTSQATAFATGVAALLIANDARMKDPQTLIQHLISHSSPRQSLKTKLRSGGVLDAKLALEGDDLELTQVSRNRTPAKAN